LTGQAPQSIGNRHPSITPFEPYDAADRPLIIAAGNDALFGRLCTALGRPVLAADPRFVSNRERNRHAEALKAELETVLKTAPAEHWIAILEAAGVPCSLINTVADAVEHPQVQSRNMVVSADGLRMAGNPVKLSAFPDGPTRRPAPALDADGDRIRREFTSGTSPARPG
jgi:CoA:oxalate CoA-transferase